MLRKLIIPASLAVVLFCTETVNAVMVSLFSTRRQGDTDATNDPYLDEDPQPRDTEAGPRELMVKGKPQIVAPAPPVPKPKPQPKPKPAATPIPTPAPTPKKPVTKPS